MERGGPTVSGANDRWADIQTVSRNGGYPALLDEDKLFDQFQELVGVEWRERDTAS